MFPHTHEQNGSMECKHRHIVEMDLTLLAHPSAPLTYWAEAFQIVSYLINKLPTLVLHNHSPFRKLFNFCPTIPSYMSSDVNVGLTSSLTINKNWIIDPPNAFSSVIVPPIMATNVSIFLLAPLHLPACHLWWNLFSFLSPLIFPLEYAPLAHYSLSSSLGVEKKSGNQNQGNRFETGWSKLVIKVLGSAYYFWVLKYMIITE